MCLAVPGKVLKWLEREPVFSSAIVEFAGAQRKVCMACVPDASEDDFVLVHAGIAIARIDAEEAERMLATFDEIDQSWSE